MSRKDCDIVQDLLALYAEGEVSAATASFVEEHLSACGECGQLLEDFQKPIFPAPGRLSATPGKKSEKSAAAFLTRLRRTLLAALVLLVVSTTGLASASYYAGKNVAMRDPAYARAERMGLITPVRQTKQLGQSLITVDGILFDAAHTALFYRMSPGPDRNREIEIEMQDDAGNTYPYFVGRGYRGEHFIAELAPVELAAHEVSVIFSDRTSGEKVSFDVPVDTVKP
ncbi:MAG: zf-HC2 domain-containing protein [Firmicutes bacterium]|nr:zf-HC2 domain-containing protein [Bacillota bacterium]